MGRIFLACFDVFVDIHGEEEEEEEEGRGRRRGRWRLCPSPAAKTTEAMPRVLDVLGGLSGWIPLVNEPQRLVPFREKLLWTCVTLLIFLVSGGLCGCVWCVCGGGLFLQVRKVRVD